MDAEHSNVRQRSHLLVTGIALTIVFVTIAFVVLAPFLRQSGVMVWDRGKTISLPRYLPEYETSIGDIPAIAEALKSSHAPVAYAAFAFNRATETDPNEALNIQLSMENGALGFDWVLLGQPNIDDRDRFLAFLEARGIEASDRNENGVHFLRVEHGDPDQLASSVIREMYLLPDNTSLGLYHEGFAWPPETHS